MINLSKGQRIDLSKEAPQAQSFILGCGWDTRIADGAAFDLDVAALLLDAAGKPLSGAGCFVFYGNKRSNCGGVSVSPDNTTGEGEGDDETVKVDLNQISDAVSKVVLVVNIHEAEARNQNFGMVNNAYVRILQDDKSDPVARYDLTEDYSVETSVVFGELYKKDGAWRFAANGDGFGGGLKAFLAGYGVEAG